MTDAGRGTLAERFPALRRLERRNRRRIPFVQQLQTVDCGAACLAMVLGYHGRDAGLDDVRKVMGSGRGVGSALDILNAARWFGMRGRGLRLEISDLAHLEPGAILHWQLNHFVVLEKVTRKGVWVLDPAVGRRRIALPEMSRSFTGVALELEPTSEFTQTKRSTERFRKYVERVLHKTRVLRRVLFTSLLVQSLALALPIFTGALVDQVIPRGDYELLLVLCLGFFGLTVFGYVTQLVRGHLLLQLRVELDVQMSLDLVDHLAHLPFSFFQTRQTGDLMVRLNSSTMIREILTSSAVSAMLDGSLVLGYLVLLFFVHPLMALLVLVLSALRLGVYLAVRGPTARLMAENLQAQAASSNYQVQMIQGMETLKAAGAESRSVEQWSHLLVRLMNVAVQRGRLSVISDGLLNALAVISPILVLSYGGYLVLNQSLSLGTMLAITALAAGVFGPLTSLTSTALQLQLLGSYVDRVEDVLQTPLEQVVDRKHRVPRLQGEVRLDEVSFSFSGAGAKAVRNVSMKVQTGQLVAIVGPSGSGKSTLARIILGLYEPTEGTVLFDEVPLRDCDLATIRRQIGFVPQTPQFFDTTIRTNIALADPDASLDAIQVAARLACIHDDIEAMPLRYDTVLGAAGGTISGGQRQRIAIARALLSRPRLLILDEATSSLDGTTERKVYDNLAALDCTCVVIAHRLSTIAQADTIFVMEAGAILENGSHQQLIQRKGTYARLVSDQVRAG